MGLLILTAVLGAPVGSFARPAGAATPTTVRFLNSGPLEPAVQAGSGWSLNLEIELDEGKLRGFYKSPFEDFPNLGSRAVAYLGDPLEVSHGKGQGSQSGAAVSARNRPRAMGWPPTVAFTPGITPRPKSRPGDCPKVKRFNQTTKGEELTPLGPFLGNKADCSGYGHNRRLPGLVLVADGGPGVVTDLDFDRKQPLEAWNLAGYFQSVSYELKNARGRTTILAHMNVPWGLFNPVRWVDSALSEPCKVARTAASLERASHLPDLSLPSRLGPPPRAQRRSGRIPSPVRPRPAGERRGNTLVRVDGGPIRCEEHPFPGFLHPPREVVTLRAFLIQQKAPAKLTDLDGDGIVGRSDAIKAGFRVLSQEAVYRIRSTAARDELFDFDGNGSAVGGGGELSPAELTPPPR